MSILLLRGSPSAEPLAGDTRLPLPLERFAAKDLPVGRETQPRGETPTAFAPPRNPAALELPVGNHETFVSRSRRPSPVKYPDGPAPRRSQKFVYRNCRGKSRKRQLP